LEIYDLDGHNLGTVYYYHPVITACLDIVWRSHESNALTFLNDHSKGEIIIWSDWNCTMKDKKTKIGQLLIASLTTDQIACMLEVIASAGNLKSLMDDFMRADPDMAATVDEILKGVRTKANGKTKTRPVSHKRTMEYWNSLWRHWHEILVDVGNEEGKYAVQDHHWEEPYFDGPHFASDLEPIARDMLGLIDDVYVSVGDPELFVEALEDIEAGIASYPEWMGVEYGEPCELENYTTRCVLRWLWLGLQNESRSGIRLLAE